MSAAARILFIDDDNNFRKVIAFALRQYGYEVVTAANGEEGLARLAETLPDVILCDLKMPVMDGMSFLAALKERECEIPVVVLTAHGTIESAVEAMRAGAFDFVTKPVNREALRLCLERAIERARLVEENRRLRERVSGKRAVDRLIGASPAMVKLRKTLSKLAESDATVLLRGESGTGKELAARALHYDGPRGSTGQFVVLNCAAIPGELLESELFGHRKGSFTGAVTDRVGKFEAAHSGTLFLDEIGDMPLNLQAKLLRALQESEIQRVGENETREVNVRVVAATNQPLEQKIADGSFREDLYYRLSVIPLEIPPLRSRKEDLPLLLKHLLASHGSAGAEVSDEAMNKLENHPWHGNVRELENTIMRACALRPGLKRLEISDVESLTTHAIQTKKPLLVGGDETNLPSDGINFEELEKNLLLAAWKKSGQNQTAGAKLLGLTRQAFIYRLQKFGILPAYGEGKKDSEE
ncbi:MAG: sigma-54 dependent transcriptional regulator [bacterium]